MSTKALILEVLAIGSAVAAPFFIVFLMRKEKQMEKKPTAQSGIGKILLAFVVACIGIVTLIFKGISFLLVGDSKMIDEIVESEKQTSEQKIRK